MKVDDAAKREAQAQWDKWHALQAQIKALESVIGEGNKINKQYEIGLMELRKEEEAVRERFERMLKKLRE